jgi:hypothetical protein
MKQLAIGRGAWLLTGARLSERFLGQKSPAKGRDVNRLRRKRKLAEREYEAMLPKIIARKARSRARRETSSDAWPRELESVIRRRGYAPVFLYSPVVSSRVTPRLTRPRAKRLRFLDFADPARYPDLYEYASRGRTSHVNKAGAVFYSKHLARELVALDLGR